MALFLHGQDVTFLGIKTHASFLVVVCRDHLAC
jgi:hypothetical protein